MQGAPQKTLLDPIIFPGWRLVLKQCNWGCRRGRSLAAADRRQRFQLLESPGSHEALLQCELGMPVHRYGIQGQSLQADWQLCKLRLMSVPHAGRLFPHQQFSRWMAYGNGVSCRTLSCVLLLLLHANM